MRVTTHVTLNARSRTAHAVVAVGTRFLMVRISVLNSTIATVRTGTRGNRVSGRKTSHAKDWVGYASTSTSAHALHDVNLLCGVCVAAWKATTMTAR